MPRLVAGGDQEGEAGMAARLNPRMVGATDDDGEPLLASLAPEQRTLFAMLDSYADVFYPQRTLDNREQLRLVYVLHALNHVMTSRTRVLRHNAKLKAADDKAKARQAARESKDTKRGKRGKHTKAASASDPNEDGLDNEDEDDEVEYRDQGFTRPRVLIVVPYRSAAFKVINLMLRLAVETTKEKSHRGVKNKKRFLDEFGDGEEQGPKHPNDEYNAIFEGNTDDAFRIGISVTRTTMSLYANFSSADIIVASPLGLRMITGAEGDKKREFDFLSSIEICVFDQAEAFLMQNWEHVDLLTSLMNKLPTAMPETDIMRIRRWSLDGFAALFRQTIVFSGVVEPEIERLFARQCRNLSGRVKMLSESEGILSQVVFHNPQVFQRVDGCTVADMADKRFRHFVDHVLPDLNSGVHENVLIVIPSYFDFVRLRNHFRREKLSLAQVGRRWTPASMGLAQHVTRELLAFHTCSSVSICVCSVCVIVPPLPPSVFVLGSIGPSSTQGRRLPVLFVHVH
eukprot:m.400405 g.400405  ORF g.400405 m.400405 type:complete len:513 (+) comp20114_c4_seq8:704-2242(+)